MGVEAQLSGRVRQCRPDLHGKALSLFVSNGCVFYNAVVFFCQEPGTINLSFQDTAKCVKSNVPACNGLGENVKVTRCIAKTVRECNLGTVVLEVSF